MGSLPAVGCHEELPAARPWPVVLYFHHVGVRRPHYTSVAFHDFRRAIDVLLEVGSVVALSDVLREPDPPSEAGPRFVLTFDDGYAETVEAVAPLLDDAGIRATFFVVTSWVGTSRRQPWSADPLPHAGLGHLRELERSGHDIASHFHTHAPLDQLSPSAAQADWRASQEWLAGNGLGARCEGVAAYPYGILPAAPLHGLRYGFSTVKAPPLDWSARPLAIRRVYLDADDPVRWPGTVRAWVRQGASR